MKGPGERGLREGEMPYLETEGGQRIRLDDFPEYTLGRKDPASGSFPEVDLGPFGALEAGVSRKHAKITRVGEGRYYIMDLMSTNSTAVNGEVLEPFKPRLLEDGDEITLGLMRLVYRGRS